MTGGNFRMTECFECKYYIRYFNGTTTCLMKNDFQIIDGCTIFPKDCKSFCNRSDVE